MNEREALKLALEALEKNDHRFELDRYENGGPTRSVGQAAITAIREALAQPEQEPVLWVNPNLDKVSTNKNLAEKNGLYIPLYAAPLHQLVSNTDELPKGCAPLEQEPVGYWDKETGDYSRVGRVGWTPLYTTPPQRKPLIREEVEAFKKWFDAWWLGDQENGQVVPTQGHELFANYISEYTLAFGAWMAAKETAHGIKE